MEQKLRPAMIRDVPGIVEVHERSFQGFFLTFLGRSFLATLYRGIIEDSGGLVFVSEIDNKVAGFVAGSLESAGLYRRLLQQRWWRFGIAAAGAAMRRPRIVPRLLRAFAKPREKEGREDIALLMSVAVDPQAEGRRVGTALVDAFRQEAMARGAKAVVLTTDRDDNERANRFYQARGFRLARSFVTPEGRAMNEYICDL